MEDDIQYRRNSSRNQFRRRSLHEDYGIFRQLMTEIQKKTNFDTEIDEPKQRPKSFLYNERLEDGLLIIKEQMKELKKTSEQQLNEAAQRMDKEKREANDEITNLKKKIKSIIEDSNNRIATLEKDMKGMDFMLYESIRGLSEVISLKTRGTEIPNRETEEEIFGRMEGLYEGIMNPVKRTLSDEGSPGSLGYEKPEKQTHIKGNEYWMKMLIDHYKEGSSSSSGIYGSETENDIYGRMKDPDKGIPSSSELTLNEGIFAQMWAQNEKIKLSKETEEDLKHDYQMSEMVQRMDNMERETMNLNKIIESIKEDWNKQMNKMFPRMDKEKNDTKEEVTNLKEEMESVKAECTQKEVMEICTLKDELKNNLAEKKDDIRAMYKLVKQCSGIGFSDDKSELRFNIKRLYKNIIRIFKNIYRGYIFDKIRNKQSYNESEKLMINSLTLVITAIGQYPSIYVEDCCDGVDTIIDCLSHLHNVPLPNDVATRIVHICLYSLCDIIDYRIIPILQNTSHILRGCFNNYDNNEHIKLSSAIAIIGLYHGGIISDDVRVCDDYLRSIKIVSGEDYLGFSTDRIIGCITAEVVKPTDID